MTDPDTGKYYGRANRVRFYDPRWRPWYIKCKDAKKAIWSDLYLFAGAGTGITATVPIRTMSGRFIGVVGIDYQLFALERYLFSTLSEDDGMTAFVMD